MRSFDRLLTKIPEHTGGPDGFPGGNNWTNAQFHQDIAAKRPAVVTAKRAYLEQRQIASVLGVHYLADHPLAKTLTRRLEALRPAVPDTSKLAAVARSAWGAKLTVRTHAGDVTLGLDPATGGITTLTMAGQEWAGENNPIGQFIYRTFNDTDYKLQNGFCCYGLPGRQLGANPNQTTTSPKVTGLWLENSTAPRSLTARLAMPALQHELYGAPQELWLQVAVEENGTVSLDLQAFNKTATRLGEASFLRFRPVQRHNFHWLMDKLGSWVDPLDTVTNGSMHSHGVRDGVGYFPKSANDANDEEGSASPAFFAIDTLDAFVADPATAADPATNFLMPLTALKGPVLGFDMQLHQNAFSTNMPLFSLDSDFRWRFRLRAGSAD
jgi:hypothetical protein